MSTLLMMLSLALVRASGALSRATSRVVSRATLRTCPRVVLGAAHVSAWVSDRLFSFGASLARAAAKQKRQAR